MALIKCKDCGKDVSQDAIACPQCGNDIQKQVKSEKEKKQREKEKKELKATIDRNKQISKWAEKGELCPWCQSHCPGDTCPTCGKAKKTPMWANICAGILVFLVVGAVIMMCVQSCESADKKDKEIAKEEYKCAMKSSATRTCSYSVYSNKCE